MSTKLKEAFMATKLPVGHLDAYKEGAAHGYLTAKRQMVEALDKRIEHCNTKAEDEAGCCEYDFAATQLELVRSYVRNVMLFKKE